MDPEELGEIGESLDGIENFAEYTKQAVEKVIAAARMSGCNCNPKVLIARPYVDALGVQLDHEASCMGLLRFRGMEGQN